MRASAAIAPLLFVLAVGGVAKTQPRLAAVVHQVKERDDVFALPPPGELRAASLGWTAAVVDVLWSQLLVAYGTHWSEHREFRNVSTYVDGIVALDPKFAPIYRYVGTLLAYRPLRGTEDDVRRARATLERGTRERPTDWRLWRDYGEFLAFVAPSFLSDPAEQAESRKVGAEAMGQAVELGADADNALSAATLLSEAGRTRDAIRFLYRAYEFTSDPSMADVHEDIGNRLAGLQATAWRQEADEADTVVGGRMVRELPFVDRSMYLLLGPVPNVDQCAGLAAGATSTCARDWMALVGSTLEDTAESESTASPP
jgi:hypothetical protein